MPKVRPPGIPRPSTLVPVGRETVVDNRCSRRHFCSSLCSHHLETIRPKYHSCGKRGNTTRVLGGPSVPSCSPSTRGPPVQGPVSVPVRGARTRTVVENQCSLPASGQCPRGPSGQSQALPIGEACTTEKKHRPEDAALRAFGQMPQGHRARAPLLLSQGLAPQCGWRNDCPRTQSGHLGSTSAGHRECRGRRWHTRCAGAHL